MHRHYKSLDVYGNDKRGDLTLRGHPLKFLKYSTPTKNYLRNKISYVPLNFSNFSYTKVVPKLSLVSVTNSRLICCL